MKMDWKAAAVACIAGATMGIELVQTRVLSYLYYNHVVYLTVTIALLGFGVSGVLVSLFSKRLKDTDGLASGFAGLFAVSIPTRRCRERCSGGARRGRGKSPASCRALRWPDRWPR
jgi:hypothetical protein